MAIRKIAKLGHPVLRRVARELSRDEIYSPEIQSLVRDMIETMHEYDGLGLAAPQVHESVQLVVLEFKENNARYPNMGSTPLLVLFNPKVTVLDPNTQEFWEGCLSVPEMRGLVARPQKIRVDYLDEKAERKTIEADGFLATVFQHELDHLDGTLYVDRLVDPKKFCFLDEFRRFHHGAPVAD
jgi:peptide deformylase